VGGLVGNNAGTIASSFWNSDTAGVVDGVGSGSVAGVTSLTSAGMQTVSNFTGASWDFASTWTMFDGHTNPLLQEFDQLISGTVYTDISGATLATGQTIGVAVDGALLTSKIVGSNVTDTNGIYFFDVAAKTVASNQSLLAYVDGGTSPGATVL